MILHTGRQAEAALREAGFTIPMFPEKGAVLFDDVQVGYADNFTGITICDENETAVRAALAVSKNGVGMGVWNIPAYV